MGPGAHADAVQTKKMGEKALGAKLQHVGKGRGWGKKTTKSEKNPKHRNFLQNRSGRTFWGRGIAFQVVPGVCAKLGFFSYTFRVGTLPR